MLKSLNVAQSGLNAAKIAVENVSNNIANENTPGYKKRVVQLSELELVDSRFTGRGVQADEAYRITSQYMYDNLMDENSKSNYYNEISTIVGNVESMFQESDSSGFSSDIDRYFQSVENLRSNPNSEIYKTTFKSEGTVLVESLQNLYSDIEKQEELTRLSLEDNVEKVNSLIVEIGSVNEQLGQHTVASNDLLDKRDELEKELSNYVDIEVDRSNDDYELKVGGQVAVRFNTNIREIELVDENTTQIDRFTFIDNDKDNNVYDGIKNIKDTDGNISERVFLPGDVVTYKLDNENEISVTIGEDIFDTSNPPQAVDLGNGTNQVDSTNLIRALVYKINHNTGMSESLTAYNGNYSLDKDDNKITSTTKDEFLVLESKTEGELASFEGRISIVKAESPIYKSSTVAELTDKVDSNSLLASTVSNNQHMIIDSQTFTTVDEDYDLLATQINNSIDFSASYDELSSTLLIENTGAGSAQISIDTSTNPTYADIIATIDNTVGYSASAGEQLVLNGETFITAGEDYSALATEITASASFTAIYNAGTEELTINGETFLTTGNSYSEIASLINDSDTFTSSTEDRGEIIIDIEGNEKVFTVTDTMTYQDLIEQINLDSDLKAELSSDGNLVIAHKDGITELTITESLPTEIGINQVELDRDTVFKDEYQSQEAENKVFLSVYGSEISAGSGILKAQVENLTSESSSNKLVDYKEKLDNFARTMSDLYSKFIKTDEDEYLYGHVASDAYDGSKNIKSINLFTGGDVKSLQFNENAVNDLIQSDLDYMATIQWKKDIEFDGFEQDGSSVSATSFSEFYQEVRVNISSDKENNDFLLDTQESVQQSIQTNYDQLTKVDSDEEMVNLIKFQAAYTANAKIITVVDEMLQTILNIR